MQHGDRPMLTVRVKDEKTASTTNYILEIKVGYYTTVELSTDQWLSLLDTLLRIKSDLIARQTQAITAKGKTLTCRTGK